MAVSFQSLEFNDSTTTIQQRALARHPPLHQWGEITGLVDEKCFYPRNDAAAVEIP